MKEIELGKLRIIIDDNIVVLDYKKEAIINEKEAIEIYSTVVNNIDKNIRYGLLTIATNIRLMTRGARDFFANNPIENMNCNAVVYSNIIQTITADLYVSLSHPKMETKFFTDKTKAINWLKAEIS